MYVRVRLNCDCRGPAGRRHAAAASHCVTCSSPDVTCPPSITPTNKSSAFPAPPRPFCGHTLSVSSVQSATSLWFKPSGGCESCPWKTRYSNKVSHQLLFPQNRKTSSQSFSTFKIIWLLLVLLHLQLRERPLNGSP